MPEPAKCISSVSLGNLLYVAGGTLTYVLTFDTRAKIWTSIGDALACERASCGMTLCTDMVRFFNILWPVVLDLEHLGAVHKRRPQSGEEGVFV